MYGQISTKHVKENPMSSKPSPAAAHRRRPVRTLAVVVAGLGASALGIAATQVPALAAPSTQASPQAQLSSLRDVTVSSVVAPNGDANPYGLAVVPKTIGNLTAGNVLVADFNNQAGAPAQGSTIVQVNPLTGASSVFYQGSPVAGPVGIAINPLNDGVWVGDYGSSNDGTASNDLLIVPNTANPDGPGIVKAVFDNSTTTGTNFLGVWGQGVSDANGVSFYWGNAGNGSSGTGGGDVWRLTPHPAGPSNGQPVNATYAQIAAGQAQTPPGGGAAGAAGPQGFAFDQATGTLYETNDANNTIYAIPAAATATTPQQATVVYSGPAINTPENVVIDPANGNLLVASAGNNSLVEITPSGQVVATRDLAPGQAPGALFGLAVGTDAAGNPVIYYDNDNTNTLHALVVRPGDGA
jgi:hypothetical protein